MKLDIKAGSLAAGITFAVFYLLDIGYSLISPPDEFHIHLMEAFYPGFKWFSFSSFILGLVESIIYGIAIGAVFISVYNRLAE
jgi:hypothetical protein